MTSTIATKLQTQIADKIIYLIIGLASGLFLTATMFWSLQKLIQGTDPEVLSASTKVSLDNSNIKNDSAFSQNPLAVAKLHHTQNQPVVPEYSLLNETNEPNISIEMKHPTAKPGVSVSAGFSLGVGEGSYLPVIKVYPQQGRFIRKAKRLPRIDGFCTIQNPVIRDGAVRDSNILKGRCSTGSNG